MRVGLSGGGDFAGTDGGGGGGENWSAGRGFFAGKIGGGGGLDHAELVMAQAAGIKVTKRDDLTAFLVEKLGLKMVAVAGTHGKTTTTAMIVWAGLKMGLPISYIVGTTLGFAPSGAYHKGDKYFVYEADEYDRNFLKFHPWLAVEPAISYDHPDIYPTREDYAAAFQQFETQSAEVLTEGMSEGLTLAGEMQRHDAGLAVAAVWQIFEDTGQDASAWKIAEITEVMNAFPGVGRRFERIFDGVYTDYAHHPEEIAATVEMAREEARNLGKKGMVAVYQPHQNTRQHEVRGGYEQAFMGVDKLYWLPTYLTREDSNLAVLTPEELIASLENAEVAEVVEMDERLAARLLDWQKQGYLVLLMTAGPADEWFRRVFEGESKASLSGENRIDPESKNKGDCLKGENKADFEGRNKGNLGGENGEK